MTAESEQINGAHTRRRHNSISYAPVQRLYDLKQAAQYLGRPVWGVRELIWSGKLPVIQDGRKMYVDLYDMNRYIELEKTTLI